MTQTSGSSHFKRVPGSTGATVDERAIEAVARLYHAYLTGLILFMVSRKGSRLAAELVFRLFRRKHLEQFLPGLEKLGLRQLPDAVACAQYHYLSNQLGGVKVEYIYESDQKAWIRYPPPRWIWAGTAIAGIPSEVSAAMLRGWHAHNGVSLENPRLGFVCTKQTVDGQPGLEGYYLEHDHDLDQGQRLRFARDEEAPPFDSASAPTVSSDLWPPERLGKAYRNYAMDYVASALSELVELLGPEEAQAVGGLAARLIGMQHADEIAALCQASQLPTESVDASGFAELFARLAAAQGDQVQVSSDRRGIVLEQSGWRLMDRTGRSDAATFGAWNELWVGVLSSFDRFLVWRVIDAQPEQGAFVWRIENRHSRDI